MITLQITIISCTYSLTISNINDPSSHTDNDDLGKILLNNRLLHVKIKFYCRAVIYYKKRIDNKQCRSYSSCFYIFCGINLQGNRYSPEIGLEFCALIIHQNKSFIHTICIFCYIPL